MGRDYLLFFKGINRSRKDLLKLMLFQTHLTFFHEAQEDFQWQNGALKYIITSGFSSHMILCVRNKHKFKLLFTDSLFFRGFFIPVTFQSVIFHQTLQKIRFAVNNVLNVSLFLMKNHVLKVIFMFSSWHMNRMNHPLPSLYANWNLLRSAFKWTTD